MGNIERPVWTENVLQGLAYWIGYKKQYYRFYPLSEGAIVGEVLSLLATHIDNGIRLEAEVMYKKICKGWNGNARADIILLNQHNGELGYRETIHSIIEIKRENSSKKLIREDIARLAKFLKLSEKKDARAFLLLVSQKKRPAEYVNNSGNAKHAKFEIEDYPEYYAQVRRACKATNSFENNDRSQSIENAHYACLIEVFKR